MPPCPVCSEISTHCKALPGFENRWRYSCPNCGDYMADDAALERLAGMNGQDKAVVSHQLWRSHSSGRALELLAPVVEHLGGDHLPGPDEQLENLILFWGSEQGENYGCGILHNLSHLRAKVGTQTPDGVHFIINEVIQEKLIKGHARGILSANAIESFEGALTFLGWEKYRNLLRGKSEGRGAFMAMPFGQAEVTDMVDNVFRPAVAATGFVLRRLDDEPPAGLIDNRMRVEIRRSRFVIADLTHENRGAYWEAGYAEGLGKPVIYTCKKSYFKRRTTHFDTNHCLTVLWDPAAPERTADNLKATIRATFPFDAQMDPDPLS